MHKYWLQAAGLVLVILGVSIWGLYAVGRYWMGWDITDRQFIPYHLACVIPGMLLWQHRSIRGLVKKYKCSNDKNH
ncbi:MAG: hypothetical protein KKF30_19170 [Proteobacteria bacterium]|nr:hypothetical protein [Pseudomonadota bacterium]MBU4319387.1 hypothetical protein [Pseudomonadota bacterium]MCG2829731.1 hypothetical protein [Desulfobacteraceae bacterium]